MLLIIAEVLVKMELPFGQSAAQLIILVGFAKMTKHKRVRQTGEAPLLSGGRSDKSGSLLTKDNSNQSERKDVGQGGLVAGKRRLSHVLPGYGNR